MATQAEITEIYRQVLGREPDPAGLQYWTENLANTPVSTAVNYITGGATGSDVAAAQSAATAARPTDAQIAEYVQANINNPQAIAVAAARYGVSTEDLARATGTTTQQINNYFSTAGVSQPSSGLLTTPTTTASKTPSYDVSKTVEFRNAGAGGQYGYVNGFPVLKASIADQVLAANNGYVSGDAAGTTDNALGWDTGSVQGTLANGAGVFGVRKDNEGNISGDLGAAAKALNLNTAGMTEQQQYDAINNAAKDLYLVSGKTGYQAGGVGEEYKGVKQTAAIPGATTNHATVLYRKEGDALVPITETAQYFNGEMELSPGGGLSGFIKAVAPIAGIALMATGAGAGLGSALLSGAGVTGASAATAGALGGGLIGGGLAAATGGNVLTGAVLGGAGGYAAGGGFSNVSDTLKSAFSNITGVPTAELNNVFAAQDALTMAQNGMSSSAIQQNLIASGMDSITAASLADAAVMPNASVSGLTSAIGSAPTYTNVAGMLSGGNAFATTQSVYDQLLSSGMTPAQATQAINTAGGGLGLGQVGLDASGKLIQTAAGSAGSLLGGGTAGAATAGAGTALTNALSGAGKDIATGLLGTAAGLYGAQADKAALEKYAAELKAAAATAAPQMQFQPIGMTTRFGSTTTPQYDANGRLIGYGYTPAADIAAQRDKLLTLSGQALPTTTNIQQATTDYYNQLQALQQPGREQELAALQSRLQATGRGGLAFGATTGTGGANALAATNPELAAYYNALAQTQAQQALTAQDVAQQRLNQQIATSGNLFTQAGALETAAQQPLTMGTNLGTLTTAGSTNAAKAQLEAAQLAAQLQSQGALGVNRAVTSGLTGLAPAAGGLLSQAGQYIGSLF